MNDSSTPLLATNANNRKMETQQDYIDEDSRKQMAIVNLQAILSDHPDVDID